jgi:hypothetical protein
MRAVHSVCVCVMEADKPPSHPLSIPLMVLAGLGHKDKTALPCIRDLVMGRFNVQDHKSVIQIGSTANPFLREHVKAL